MRLLQNLSRKLFKTFSLQCLQEEISPFPAIQSATAHKVEVNHAFSEPIDPRFIESGVAKKKFTPQLYEQLHFLLLNYFNS